MGIFKRKSAVADDEVVAMMTYDVTDAKDIIALRESLRYSRANSKKSWGWYEKIGEISQAVDRGSRVAGYANIEVRKVGTTAVLDNQKATNAKAEIYSPHGGKRQLFERFVQLMKIDCECHLVRNVQTVDGVKREAGYDFISTDELYVADDSSAVYRLMYPDSMGKGRYGFGTTKELDENPFVEKLDAGSYLGRIWIPHPRFTGLPKPGLWRLDLVCEELYTLTLSLLSRINQRLVMGGVFYVPSEISDVSTSGNTIPGGVGEDLQTRYGTSSKVVAQIIHGMVTNIAHKGEAMASMPFIMVGAKGEKPEMIDVDRSVDLVELQLRGECLERVLNGLDAEKSSVTGTQDSNHWSAKTDQDSDVRVNFGPELERMQWVLTAALGPELLQTDEEFWIDTDPCVSRPNKAEDARQAAELGAVSPRGLRQTSGIPETFAPSQDELARMTGWKTGNAWLILKGEPKTPEDWEEVLKFSGKAKPGPSGDQSSDGTVDGTQPETSDPTPESDTPKADKPR